MKYRMIIGACVCALTCGLLFAAGISHAKVVDEDMGAVVMAAEQIKETLPESTKTSFYTTAGIEKYLSALKDRDMETRAAAVGRTAGNQMTEGTAVQGLSADDTALQELSTGEAYKEDPTADGTASETAEKKSEYADLAIAHVDKYVNVRTGPNTDSSIVGKIYDGAVAHILSVAGEENDWFQIISGDVEGFIKAEFFLYGDAAFAVIDNYVTRYATVLADRLNVRNEPDVESKRIGSLDKGEKVKILENLGEWLKVQYTDNSTGYVAAEYVTVSEEFVYAKSLEEEARELEEKRTREERERIPEVPAAESSEAQMGESSEAQATEGSEAQSAESSEAQTAEGSETQSPEGSSTQTSEGTVVDDTTADTTYSTNEELRQQIVDYAMQYLGNRYVHGGKTLAGGTDCSGFTSLIYQEFGYSLSRTPGGQLANAGRSVDYSEAQPGDILCYGSNGQCTHVAMYIGDGKMIHSSTPQSGVIIGNAEYTTIMAVKNVID